MSSSPLQDDGPQPKPILHGRTTITCDPVRSPLDKRSYCLEKLGNKLLVQWAHSPGADKSTVVMEVASGSLNDTEVPGIGHALEHLLFMGSQKYPRRDEFAKRINKHGGWYNGWTGLDYTHFEFQINTNAADKEASAKLKEVLDVFLHMFIDPTFELDAVKLETKTIESEFKGAKPQNVHRLQQLEDSLSNPKHPKYPLFRCGNGQSLGDPAELLRKVVEHYKKHYCAGLMRCVIVSPLPIQDLQNQFAATLADIPNNGLSKKVWGTIPRFLEKDLGTETFVEPVGDTDTLYIDFYFPGKQNDGYSARGDHAVDLLQQKAEGSLFNVLHGRKLVHSLSARTEYQHTDHRKMSIEADLTKAGVKNYQEVVQEVFHMIARMKAEGPQQKRVEEQTKLLHIHFCTRQTSDHTVASRVATNMGRAYILPENLVWGSNEISVASRFNADDVVKTLESLQPKNMRLTLLSTEFQHLATEIEKWFETKWVTRTISQDDMARYNTAVALPLNQLPPEPKLPPPNRFITAHNYEDELLGLHRGRPAQASGTAEGDEEPRPPPTALQTGKNDIWFAPGRGLWEEPRIKIAMCIRPNNIFSDAGSSVKRHLFLESFSRATTALRDQFERAGMGCGTGSQRDDLTIWFTGFKDVLQPMIDEYLQALRNHKPAEADFAAIKEHFLQLMHNQRLKNPSNHSSYYLNLLTSDKHFSLEQEEAALKAFTFEDLQDWGAKIFNTTIFKFLIVGNVTEADAKNMWPICQEKLELKWRPGEETPRRQARLPPSGRISLFKRVMVDPKNENSHVNAVVFLGASRLAERIAAPMLLVQILEGKAFDTLRTEHGLAYSAGMCTDLRPQHSALRVYVECPKHSCLEAAGFMLKFMEQASGMVEQLSLEEIDQYRKACIDNQKPKVKTLDEYVNWAWIPIGGNSYAFRKHERLVDEFGKVTKKELVNLARQMNPTFPRSTHFWLFMESKERETAQKNPDYIELFPKDREVAFVTDVSDFPDLSAPEDPEENPDDFLVKSQESIVIR